MNAGSSDLAAAAAALATRLPEPLRPLARIAYNYRWSWTPGGPELFAALDERRWTLCGTNPVRLLQEIRPDKLERAAADGDLLDAARRARGQARVRARRRLRRPSRSRRTGPAAFFCAEYAVHYSLPVYSGGLGVLAGDILKESSDRGLPLVAVGLMYRHGYFRQRIDASGWQHEYWVETDPDRVPAALVTGDDGEPVTVTVPLGERQIVAQIWRVDVGRVPLLLLDADRPENDTADRWITSRLYVGDADLRLGQYALLGIGGVRALRALGVEPGVVHLNEGHAALACLELAAGVDGESIDDRFAAVRDRTVFTTHTPVPAGNDTYPPELMADVLSGIAGELGVDPWSLVRRGRTRPDEEQRAVRRHPVRPPLEPHRQRRQRAPRRGRARDVAGPVAGARHRRRADHARHQRRPHPELDRRVDARAARPPSRRRLGGPRGRSCDVGPVDDIPAEELWQARCDQRRELIAFTRERSVTDRLARGDTAEYVRAAVEALDPDVLTVGFARRVATYKRLDLLLRDAERALALLDSDRPIQLLLAGKAHPRDDDGKRLVQRLFGMKSHLAVARRVVYLDDYDLVLGAAMTSGCDIWVNVPRPPLEASGTSGMKNAMNGGLQLSVLDGWWPEAYDGTDGWAISGEVEQDHEAQDYRHADELYRLLGDEAVPAFYERDGERAAREVDRDDAVLAAHDRPRVRRRPHDARLRAAHLPRRLSQSGAARRVEVPQRAGDEAELEGLPRLQRRAALDEHGQPRALGVDADERLAPERLDVGDGAAQRPGQALARPRARRLRPHADDDAARAGPRPRAQSRRRRTASPGCR